MTLPDFPQRGGFLRPFGCGWFIREYLLGRGPHESPRIDPSRGAPQADIHRAYKQALHREFALDAAVREEERAAPREGRPIDPERIEKRSRHFLERIPYKTTSARYHSFVVYFSNLQRLGWVEPTGEQEPSQFQDYYPEAWPRIFYRLTREGREAPEEAWANPLFWLYRDRWSREYLRDLRRRHRYEEVPAPPPPPTPPPPNIAPPAPPAIIPPFELPQRPGRKAAQELIKHLRRLEGMDVNSPEVDQELERLGRDLGVWLDQAEEAVSREEEKDEPDEERLERLQEGRAGLEEAVAALEQQDMGSAMANLEEAFPAPPPRKKSA